MFQSFPYNRLLLIVLIPLSTVEGVMSGFGTVSILTGVIGKIVVTRLIPSVIVWIIVRLSM